MTASRNRVDSPEASSRCTGCVATLPTAQTIVSFIASPSLTRAPPAPGGYAYGPVPYGSVRRDGRRICRNRRRAARLPPPGRAR
ncbi:hypothetical protein GCM10009601_00160 [Streptomyces thermospinosisporus]|uniref:Uncharacterized protein n=1 Tax=Streptomyces thermospinosisporus TaxID=161482 RepID=A0ABN1YHB2_9ACTN